MKTADEVRAADLELMTAQLADELDHMSGRSLLIAGGAGFLGYYLVQAALHWNDRNPDRDADSCCHPGQLRSRSAPLAHAARGASGPDADPTRHHGAVPVRPRPARVPGARRVDRVADLLPPVPDRDDGRQRERAARTSSSTPARRSAAGSRSRASSSSRAARSTAIRRRRTSRPPRRTAATCPAPGPAPATTSRSATARRCASTSREQHGLPVKVARPFNNYGPGLKITDRRVIPDFARDILDGRDIVMLSDGSPEADVLLRRRRRRRATTRSWSTAGRARRTTSASRRPRSRWPSSPSASSRSAGSCSATRGEVVRQESADKDYLVDNPNRRCPRIDQGADGARVRPADRARRGPAARRSIWYSDNREAGRRR